MKSPVVAKYVRYSATSSPMGMTVVGVPFNKADRLQASG